MSDELKRELVAALETAKDYVRAYANQFDSNEDIVDCHEKIKAALRKVNATNTTTQGE